MVPQPPLWQAICSRFLAAMTETLSQPTSSLEQPRGADFGIDERERG
jgi:hypothetical protein